MSVIHLEIKTYFSPLSVYCLGKYVTLDMRDFRSISDACGLAACLICRQDSGN